MKKRGLNLLFVIVLSIAGYGQAQAMGGVMMLLGMGMMVGMMPGGGAMHGPHGAASGHGDGDAGQGRPPQEQTPVGQRDVAGEPDPKDTKAKVKRPEQERPEDVHTH